MLVWAWVKVKIESFVELVIERFGRFPIVWLLWSTCLHLPNWFFVPALCAEVTLGCTGGLLSFLRWATRVVKRSESVQKRVLAHYFTIEKDQAIVEVGVGKL